MTRQSSDMLKKDQKRKPRAEDSETGGAPGEDVELEVGNVIVARQVDRRLQGHGFQAGTDGMRLVQRLSKDLPRNDRPANTTRCRPEPTKNERYDQNQGNSTSARDVTATRNTSPVRIISFHQHRVRYSLVRIQLIWW